MRRSGRRIVNAVRQSGGRVVTQASLTVAFIAGFLGIATYVVPYLGPSWAYGEPTQAADDSLVDDSPLALPPGVDMIPGAPAAPPPGASDETNNDDGSKPNQQLVDWADRLSPRVDISARALQAYGNAEIVLAAEKPACHLSWTTLAGIGSVETNHGTTGGTSLTADGKPATPIRGPALDGTNGNKEILDTDAGLYDDDKIYDRAVGPMQFIPTTWERWKVDGDGDGVSDPNDIDDVAVAAGYYLCADGRDLSRAADWYAGVFAYNHLHSYVTEVYSRADNYGKLSKGS